MSTMTEAVTEAVETIAPKFTWATLKTAYGQANASGTKARFKAYDTIVRGMSLTDATETDSKGTVQARSDRSRATEVLDALKVEAGNPFGLSAMRVAQVTTVYAAIGAAEVDPFTERGRALFTPFDNVRRYDVKALEAASTAVKAAEDVAGQDKAMAEAVETAKAAAKARTEANKTAGAKTTLLKVENLAAVKTFAEAALPMVREVSAKATPEDKAATRKALEALIAHLA